MEFKISKRKVKEFWEEHKEDILGIGGSIAISVAVGKMISWKIDSNELKRLKKIVGNNYVDVIVFASDLKKSDKFIDLTDDYRGIPMRELIDKAIPELKDIYSDKLDDLKIENCILLAKKS